MMIGIEIVVFAAIGLAVGAGAAVLLPDLFPVPRSLTVLTGLGSGLLLGGIGHVVLGGQLAETGPLTAVGTVLLVSVLAQPRKSAHRALRRAPQAAEPARPEAAARL
jgi:hypothetical protein